MKFFDEKFLEDKARYILQCMLATLAVFWVLFFLDIISDGIVIASLGASSFIAFTMPETQASRPRFLIGGYCVGIFTGSIFNFLQHLNCNVYKMDIPQQLSGAIFGSLAIGTTMFLMVITNTEHPPAAALSFSTAVGVFSIYTILVALVGIISLCLFKKILGRYLKNLL